MADQVVSKSDLKDINSDKGYEAYVREQQYYLMYRILDVLKSADGQGNLVEAYQKAPRLKRLSLSDQNANYKFCGTVARTTNTKYMRSIPPNVLSGLVPYVKVYKVVYPYRLAGADGGFKKEDFESLSKTFDVEVPFDYGVDPLDLNPKTSILQGRPKGYLDIANLVSFDYQYNGTNPAEQEVCITAKMKLKFSTIDALLQERTIAKTVASSVATHFQGHIVTERKDIPVDVKFKYSDLVNQVKRDSNEYYRLKIVSGYADVSIDYIKRLLENGKNVLDPNKRPRPAKLQGENLRDVAEQLATAINNSKTTMYIYPVRHEINFTENGTVEMNIDFQGAVEGIMSDKAANVLLSGPTGRTIVAKITNLESQKYNKSKEYDEQISSAAGDRANLEAAKQQVEDDFNREIKEAYSELPVLYKGFINSIYYSGKIRAINYDRKKISITDNTASSNQIEANAAILSNNRATRNSSDLDTSDLKYHTENDDSLNARVKSLGDSVDTAASGRTPGDSNSPEVKVGIQTDDGNLRFIFLQDLISHAMECIRYSDLSEEDFFIVLGNMIVPVAREYKTAVVRTTGSASLSYLGGSVVDFESASSYAVQLNIGMIPISLEFFNRWFFETVVKPAKVQYSLRNFLHDIIELVRQSTLNIFGKDTFSTPGSRVLSALTTVDKSYGDTLRSLSAGSAINLNNVSNAAYAPDASSITNLMYYFVPSIITTDIDPLKVLDNEEKNIFTFTVGASSGILKRVSYKKMDIPGMREARATQEGELTTGILRMKYDADLEMYGPSYFRPGDIIVINPVFLSKNSISDGIKKLATDLGLGGIYMVLKTNTDISRDGLITKIEAVFQSYGANTIIPKPATGKT